MKESSFTFVLGKGPSGGRILVVWSWKDATWSLPGGKVETDDDNEPTEDAIDAAMRELEEETGLKPKACYLVYGAQSGERYVNVYVCEDYSGEAQATESESPVAWVSPGTFLASTPYTDFYSRAWTAYQNGAPSERPLDEY